MPDISKKCMFGWNAEKDRQWFPYFLRYPIRSSMLNMSIPISLSRAFDFWASR